MSDEQSIEGIPMQGRQLRRSLCMLPVDHELENSCSTSRPDQGHIDTETSSGLLDSDLPNTRCAQVNFVLRILENRPSLDAEPFRLAKPPKSGVGVE